MKTQLILWLAIILLSSCGEENEPTIDNRVDNASYDYTITGSEGGPHHLIGEDVKTIWRSEDGYIFLNTDSENEPIGTLTISIGKVENGTALILSGRVSKTDFIIGTSEEMNARLFELVPPINDEAQGALTNVEIGSNYIKADIKMLMQRVLVWPDDEPEVVTVDGKFVATE